MCACDPRIGDILVKQVGKHGHISASYCASDAAACRRCGGTAVAGQEVAVDPGRFTGLAQWSAEDLRTCADLIGGAMMSIVTMLLGAPPLRPSTRGVGRPGPLRLIVLGLATGRSDRG